MLLVWRLIEPDLAYERWRYRLSARCLECEHGVLVHRSVLVPVSRVQHVDVERGPIERAFGLATVVVRTAGTASEAVRLPGLTPERAHELRDDVLLLGSEAEDVERGELA